MDGIWPSSEPLEDQYEPELESSRYDRSQLKNFVVVSDASSASFRMRPGGDAYGGGADDVARCLNLSAFPMPPRLLAEDFYHVPDDTVRGLTLGLHSTCR